MIKKKRFPTYFFYGGAFSVALIAMVLASSTGTGTLYAAFLSQGDADASASTEVRMYQQLSCADLVYDIAAVDLVLSGGSFSSPQGLTLTVGTVSGTGAWNKLKKRAIQTSGSVSFKEAGPTVVTFEFNPPIASSALCRTTADMVYMTIDRTTQTPPHPLLYGSNKNTSAYRSALYGCVLESGSPCLGDVADMAFTLHTVPNRPPSITPLSAQSVNEGETLAFTLVATDPDGDTVRWGSSNLPDGATLNETTGVFLWTPADSQVKEYKVTFIATDNGGPIEESTSLTVTITVVDRLTPPDLNQTLLENVLASGFEKNIENSYVAHLKNLESFITEGQMTAAENQLNALRGKLVQDLEQGLIPTEQQERLLHQIDTLLAQLQG